MSINFDHLSDEDTREVSTFYEVGPGLIEGHPNDRPNFEEIAVGGDQETCQCLEVSRREIMTEESFKFVNVQGPLYAPPIVREPGNSG